MTGTHLHLIRKFQFCLFFSQSYLYSPNNNTIISKIPPNINGIYFKGSNANAQLTFLKKQQRKNGSVTIVVKLNT